MSYKLKTFALILLAFVISGLSQDRLELEAERSSPVKLKGEHPLVALIKSKSSSLRPELVGVHPRVFLTQAEIDHLRKKKRGRKKSFGRQRFPACELSPSSPPKPPAEERRAQNEVGIGMAEAALVYKITGDKKYLNAAKKYMDAAVSYDVWGYSYNKPDVDLAAGHLLYGMGWAYDLLYNDLTPAEREKYRNKLVRKARLMYEYFLPNPARHTPTARTTRSFQLPG